MNKRNWLLSVVFSAMTSTAAMALSAQTKQVLHCTGGIGGPQPAQATLILEPLSNGRYTVMLQLKNRALPNGITATLQGRLYPGGMHQLFAQGKVDSVDGSIELWPETRPNLLTLEVYAANGRSFDRNITFGFGEYFTCSGSLAAKNLLEFR